MPITTSTPPPRSSDAIRDAVSVLRGTASLPEAPPTVGGRPDFSVAAPHPVYVLELDKVAAGTALDTAIPSGWRFLLLGGDQVRAAVNVAVGADGGARFSSVNRGPYVAATVEAIAAAELRDELRAGDFELRLVEVPAIKVVALWLHGPEDYLIPLPPAPPELSTANLYSADEFLGALKPRAERQTTYDERG